MCFCNQVTQIRDRQTFLVDTLNYSYVYGLDLDNLVLKKKTDDHNL